MTNMVHCQLWMGGLEPYMTESFILSSFQRMGERPLNVKVMRNKFTGEPAGYCFVHFENDDEAIDAMHKLNNKIIPNTNPPIRFRLNTATNQGKVLLNEKEFSLWVGDLTPEVDDYTLFKTFSARYQSIKAAKVILDTSGFSKGFGFVRFGSEEEQKHCLANMNGFKGLGGKPLKVSNAIPKTQRPNPGVPEFPGQPAYTGGMPPAAQPSQTTDYSHYYDPSYWQNSYWSGYYDGSGGYNYAAMDPSQYSQYSQYYQQQPQPTAQPASQPVSHNTVPVPQAPAQPTDPTLELVEHSPPVDVEKENEDYAKEIIAQWDDIDLYKWTSPELYEAEAVKMKFMVLAT